MGTHVGKFEMPRKPELLERRRLREVFLDRPRESTLDRDRDLDREREEPLDPSISILSLLLDDLFVRAIFPPCNGIIIV